MLLTGVGTGLRVQEHVRQSSTGVSILAPRHGQAGLGRPGETMAHVTPRSRLVSQGPLPFRGGAGALGGGGGAVPRSELHT